MLGVALFHTFVCCVSVLEVGITDRVITCSAVFFGIIVMDGAPLLSVWFVFAAPNVSSENKGGENS